ncbi:MAG TPA: DUF2628 domain-containing protein [Pseudolabrys sp.]|jgi:hypothetical protein|nr:DUF2628 domain-containing protein [Pseudolabrys sp.]
MPTFTVHQPPPRLGETASAPERFVFVRDGFHFWAFALAPVWLLWRRLWLAFAIYLAVSILLGIGLLLIGAGSTVQFLAGTLIALLIGFEAATFRRAKLTRRGWKMLGFVVGEDTEAAEQRFFAEWANRAREAPPEPPAAPEPRYTVPLRRGTPSPSDVIGLFPEPGSGR